MYAERCRSGVLELRLPGSSQRPPPYHADEVCVKARALLHLRVQSAHELSLLFSLLDPQGALINDIFVGEQTAEAPHVTILVTNGMIVFGDDLEPRAAIDVRELCDPTCLFSKDELA